MKQWYGCLLSEIDAFAVCTKISGRSMETATRLTGLAVPLLIPLLLNTEATSTSTKTSPGQLTHLGEQICFRYLLPSFVQLFWLSCLSDACASDRPLPGSLTFQRLRLRHVPLCEDFQRKQPTQLPSGGYKGDPDPVRGEDRRSGSLYSTGGSKWETKSKFCNDHPQQEPEGNGTYVQTLPSTQSSELLMGTPMSSRGKRWQIFVIPNNLCLSVLAANEARVSWRWGLPKNDNNRLGPPRWYWCSILVLRRYILFQGNYIKGRRQQKIGKL